MPAQVLTDTTIQRQITPQTDKLDLLLGDWGSR